MRADQLLLSQGLAPTRSAAQRLIERGAVQRLGAQGWAVLRKAGEDLPEATELRITDAAELRWVSRAGLKLDAALTHCGLDPSGATALDVGQSTGGFTEVLLARGAARVVGVDVGHGQLHPSLRGHAQVTAIEGLNARGLTRAALGAAMPAAGFDVIVADLSFIPLTTVLPALPPLLFNLREDPDEFVLVEAFKDDAAGDHVNSAHFKKAMADMPQALAETPRIISRQLDGEGWDTMGELTI